MSLVIDQWNSAVAIVPSDATILNASLRAIYVGGTGDLTVLMHDGSSATFKAVPVGAVLKLHATKVMATGTTATLLVGLW